MNSSAPPTLDNAREFAACCERFFTSPAADPILSWCFPDLNRQAIAERANACKGTEDFQLAFVDQISKRILNETSLGLTISGLDRLPNDRKFLFLSNHRCIVNDAALVSLNMLFSGRGTCKVCIGENLMETPGVAELMLLVNGVVIKRSGTAREVFVSAQNVAIYLAQQIADQRHSVWLAQCPGRTKDGDDRTDPAIIKMLRLGCGKTRTDFEKLHIVPVAISYEFEPCATGKVRETVLTRWPFGNRCGWWWMAVWMARQRLCKPLQSILRRFNYDPEVARLCWQGVRPINLVAPVRYFSADEGGVPHFNYLRDNTLLTWMHIRLMCGFALRLPLLIWRRLVRP